MISVCICPFAYSCAPAGLDVQRVAVPARGVTTRYSTYLRTCALKSATLICRHVSHSGHLWFLGSGLRRLNCSSLACSCTSNCAPATSTDQSQLVHLEDTMIMNDAGLLLPDLTKYGQTAGAGTFGLVCTQPLSLTCSQGSTAACPNLSGPSFRVFSMSHGMCTIASVHARDTISHDHYLRQCCASSRNAGSGWI